jgi:hypothetical protein
VKEFWRRNDISWAGLDAAEILVRVLYQSARDQRGHQEDFERVQREIAAEELLELQGRDYRRYLETDYRVGSEVLAEVPIQERSTLLVQAGEVFRNMLRRLERAPGPRRRDGAGLERDLARRSAARSATSQSEEALGDAGQLGLPSRRLGRWPTVDGAPGVSSQTSPASESGRTSAYRSPMIAP